MLHYNPEDEDPVKQELSSDPRFRPIKGWAEILYRSSPVFLGGKDPTQRKILLPEDCEAEDYMPVGSWMTTEEYIHTFDILLHFQNPDVCMMYNVPRCIQAYDAITLCPTNPPGIATLIVVPRQDLEHFQHRKPQQYRDNPLMLVTRDKPFPSFRCPKWRV